jgi:hypothetical protein
VAVIETQIADALTDYEEALGVWLAVTADTGGAIAAFETLLAEAKGQALPADEVLEIELTNIELRMAVLEAGYDLTVAAIKVCRAVGVADCGALSDRSEGGS